MGGGDVRGGGEGEVRRRWKGEGKWKEMCRKGNGIGEKGTGNL